MTDTRLPCPQCGSRRTLGELQDRKKYLCAQLARRDPSARKGGGGTRIRIQQLPSGIVMDAAACADCGCIYDAWAKHKAEELRREIQDLEFKLDPPLTSLARAAEPDEMLDLQ